MKNIGAFFDFDETLLEVESGRVGIQYLYDEGHAGRFFIAKVLFFNFLYQRGLISDDTMARRMIRFYKNKPLADFEQGADAFYKNHLKPRLAPNVADKVREHRKAGHRLILISGSVRYLLKPVADDLGFHYLICTDLEMRGNGRLTGRPDGPVCLNAYKKIYAEEIARREGIDLGKSYAYGNSGADIPLLRTVGNPVAVEPTEKLAGVARQNDWPVMRYR
ncbi:MAG: HAD-IB family hydrolase [Deltaproteobacteria bacterium]|nr:HAD-IB family hydrolase [Deltaproteobacteria bacterium]